MKKAHERVDRTWLLTPLWDAEIPRVTLFAQGHFVKLGIGHTQFKSRGAFRGEIVTFSAESRKRMLETLARVDTAKAGFMCFVTLTYPDREGPPSLRAIERDRQAFLKRIKRRFLESSAIWRREWEPRQSGDFVGVFFPHYHFLFFKLPFLHYAEVNDIWREILGYEGYIRTEIRAVESWRQAWYYVSKYMAKVPEEEKEPEVRTEAEPPAAGRDPVGGVPAAGGGTSEGACSLVYVAYLTADGEEESREEGGGRKSAGRFWGIFNRARFPWAESRSVRLKAGLWLDDAKALAGQEWPGVNANLGYGFTLFVEDGQELLRAICALEERNEWQFNEDGEYDPIPF